MSFIWPLALLGLLLVPLLAFAYLRGLRRPAGSAALHPDLALLAAAGSGGRRHLPAVLYLAAVALAAVAVARPTAPVPVPDNRTTIMLVLDVSLSMRADDVKPNRFEAAKDAARTFVRSLPAGLKVGLASFAGYAVLDVPPTAEHTQVIEALDRLSLGYGTAIGAGLLEGLRALPGRGENDPPSSTPPPAAIVLLSDGRNNRAPYDVLGIAAQVRDGKVTAYTVGLGTESGYLPQTESGPGGFVVGFDAETLRGIAQTTGGEYFEAKSAGELGRIYRGLGRSLGWTTRPGEVTGLVSALAGLFLVGSLAASGLSRRIV